MPKKSQKKAIMHNNKSLDDRSTETNQKAGSVCKRQQKEQSINQVKPIADKQISDSIEKLTKQQSFELYMDLTSSPQHFKQVQMKEEENGKLYAQLPQLIQIQDSGEISSLILQPSPKSQKPLKIEIVGYRSETFLTIATQIFKIKISNPNVNPVKFYEIERRFSDFVDLYEQLFYNQPGYILFPFPEKTLESFIKLKLRIVVQSPQKSELVQKRISQLQQFANWVSSHRELRNSEEFLIFKAEEPKTFQQGKNRLNQYVEQHRSLEGGSHFQNIIDKGKSILSLYFSNQKSSEKVNRKSSQQCNKMAFQAESYIKQKKQHYSKIISQAQSLLAAEKSFSQFIGIDTQNEIIQKFLAKHDSSRQFHKKYSFFLEFIFLQKFKFEIRKIEEAEKVLIHRKQILQIIETSKGNQNDRKSKLQRILERFQRNFQVDWPNFRHSSQENIKQLLNKFPLEWIDFKMQMQKVWVSKK